MKSLTNKILSTVAALAVLAVSVLSLKAANIEYYSDDIVNTNFIINASGGTGGTTTNLTRFNYANSLPNGWMSTKGLSANNPNATAVTFQFTTMQLPTGFTGTLYTNAGFVYSNGVTITNIVVPQYATNLTATLALALDDATLTRNLPPSTNNVITVAATASASTNAIQNWSLAVPSTNFLSAKYFKVLSLTYGGSNALQVVSSRAGFWTGTW